MLTHLFSSIFGALLALALVWFGKRPQKPLPHESREASVKQTVRSGKTAGDLIKYIDEKNKK